MKKNKEYKTGTYYYCLGKDLIEVEITNEEGFISMSERGEMQMMLPPDSYDIETIYETKEEALNAHIEEAKDEIDITVENIKADIREVFKYVRILGITYFRKIVVIAKQMRI